jgi:hypothetical protein
MATKTVVELIDDTDGSVAEETVNFGIDGQTYEIDLSGPNADKMRDVLQEWIDHARRTSGRVPTSSGGARGYKRTNLPDARPGFSAQERKSMQRFARENGLQPPADRGRIAASIVDAWTEAGRPT